MSDRLSKDVFNSSDSAVLAAIAEDFKAPLLEIAYTAELASLTGRVESFDQIRITARSAMAEIDSLLLGLRASEGQLVLPLSPQAPSSVVYQTLQSLKPVAKRYSCSLEYHKPKHMSLVLVHEQTLKHVLVSLAQSIMKMSEGYSRTPKLDLKIEAGSKKSSVTLTTNALIGDMLKDVTSQTAAFESGQRSHNFIVGGPAAGFYVASKLLESMQAKLSLFKKSGNYGVKIELLNSKQLSLV